ncbi:MAG: hypothetical protein D6753_04220 [Planctomycetota bacterium]|nr:MAG: hypothetical protein D6753_04220 [Planctomycetota bacterium]
MSDEGQRRASGSAWRVVLLAWYAAMGWTFAIGCDRSTPQPQSASLSSNPPIDGSSDAEEGHGAGQGEDASPSGAAEPAVPLAGASLGEEIAAPAAGTSPPTATGPSTDSDSSADTSSPSGTATPTGLAPLRSDDPQEMIRHIEQIDAQLRDLVLAGSRSLLDKEQFIAAGKQLGLLKLRAGEHLANLPAANATERKAGVIAQLVALSHLSGLGDVESARQLEELARSLNSADDPELSHQARVVLLGFELQAIQNGQRDDPNRLLELARGLFGTEKDRGFPEFMMLQQVAAVLEQMGFAEQSGEVRQLITENYLGSKDPQLRGEAWVILTRDSAELANFNTAYRQIGSPQFDPASLTAAARALVDAHPVGPTLEHLAKAISQIEYSGFIEASRQLAELIEARNQQIDASVSTRIVDDLLAAHRRRIALLGQEADFAHWLVDLDGNPINWDAYRGKVVVVDVWATWCVPCLREIPNLRQLYDAHRDQGLVILGVNVDDRLEDAREFVEKQRIEWPIARPADGKGLQSEFAQQLGIKLIPLVALIDRQGRIVKLHVRGEQLDAAVQALLQEDQQDESTSLPSDDS